MDFQDNAAFLREAKNALRDLNEAKANQSRLDMDQKRLEKTLKEEKKAINDSVRMTVRKRLDELNSTFDTEITKCNDKIKRETARRDKAISQGKKNRQKQETEGLNDQIQNIQNTIRDMLRNEGVPGYVNNDVFLGIFEPESLKDRIIQGAAALIGVILIPFLIYKILPVKGTLALVIIYILCILALGALYIFVRERTTATHPSVIKAVRGNRGRMQELKKEVRKIEDGIAKDEDISYYDLSEFDAAIEELQGKLAQTVAQKQAALDNFENVTRRDIIDEIRMNSQGRIDDLEATLEQTTRDLRMTEEDVSALSLSFSQNYSTYIDKDFLQENKLDKLIEILDSGEANSITEAQNVYRMR